MVQSVEVNKLSPTPTIGELEEVGSQNSLSTEYVAPVSKRKEMDCPDTVMNTRGIVILITDGSSSQVIGARAVSFVQGQAQQVNLGILRVRCLHATLHRRTIY